MSKKATTKASEVKAPEVINIDIEVIEEELGIDIIEEAIELSEVKEEEVKVIEKSKESKAQDIINKIKGNAPEYADLTDGITPNQIDALFSLGDQGKTVRRYLRKYFSDNHIHKNGWALTKKEATEVIAFLATRYGQPNWKSLKKEAQA